MLVLEPQWICEACNGPLTPLGVLGEREHARCRACGLDHSRYVTLPLMDDEDGEIAEEDLQNGREQFDAWFSNDMKPRG